jgi:hypothetical protein
MSLCSPHRSTFIRAHAGAEHKHTYECSQVVRSVRAFVIQPLQRIARKKRVSAPQRDHDAHDLSTRQEMSLGIQPHKHVHERTRTYCLTHTHGCNAHTYVSTDIALHEGENLHAAPCAASCANSRSWCGICFFCMSTNNASLLRHMASQFK